MSHSINPIIHGQLLAFRGRFRWLQFLRGASAGLIMFLGGMLLLAAADWFVVMADRTRWMLSGGVYLVALIVGWFACVRPLLRVLKERLRECWKPPARYLWQFTQNSKAIV